ncbi:MAG: chlorite dismutase family protein [Thermoanaerobaculia bacterium]
MAEGKPQAGPARRSLNHYAVFRFTPAFWDAGAAEQKKIGADLAAATRAAAERVYAYRIFPARPEADFLLWSAARIDAPESPARFIHDFARAIGRFRRWIEPVNTLWGFTRGSEYASGRSAQDIDPFDDKRSPYLVIYPFAKTIAWYLMSRDARQGMMNEHIRIGREYPEITQLLLYSTGLQDQEFVVSYETDDLPKFSELVTALRDTEARRYTLTDTPNYAATLVAFEELFELA